MTQKIILDMDPGIDDAAAIAIALTDPEFDVQLLSTVAGNVDAHKTTLNALKLVEFFNVADKVPVATGAQQPLLKHYEDASHVHGESGMPGWDFPAVTTKPLAIHAVEALRQTLLDSPEPLTVVATGAFTNLALLFSMYPDVKTKIDRIVLMGGSLVGGNMTSVAEFNIYTDPHAAQMVMRSGLPIVMIGLDVTMKALLTHENIEMLADINQGGAMLQALFKHYGDTEVGGKPMHDVNTLFYLMHPEAFTLTNYWVDVITEGPAIGGTIADVLANHHDGKTNVAVATDIDVEAFNAWFMSEVKNYL